MDSHCRAKNHYNNKLYKCNFCKKSFSSQQALNNHFLAKKHNKIFCNICKRIFKSNMALNAHRKDKGH